jgi:hypothetical protein
MAALARIDGPLTVRGVDARSGRSTDAAVTNCGEVASRRRLAGSITEGAMRVLTLVGLLLLGGCTPDARLFSGLLYSATKAAADTRDMALVRAFGVRCAGGAVEVFLPRDVSITDNAPAVMGAATVQVAEDRLTLAQVDAALDHDKDICGGVKSSTERAERPGLVQVEEDGIWLVATRDALARIYRAIATPTPPATATEPTAKRATESPAPASIPPIGPEGVPDEMQPTFDAPAAARSKRRE